MAGKKKDLPPDSAEEEALALAQAGAEGEEGEYEDEEEDSDDYLIPASPPYGDDDDDYDPDLEDMNNPDVTTLGEPPLIGGGNQRSEIFGEAAESMGRVSSPKLYAQAAQFPTAVQFRAWRWENGIPVALGAIDSEASEEDFIRRFYNAMPQPGDGKFQFRFRPVDMRGKELGKEFTLNFSEHHAEVARIRKQKERENKERGMDPLVIQQGGDGAGNAAYAEEMGRMFESAVEASERRTELLQQSLEEERNRMRDQETARYQERVAVADRSTEVVTKMTDRLMETDRARSNEQMQSQQQQNQLMLSTITTVFQQQQESARVQAERVRESDSSRMGQDREFFERQRQEMESRRQGEAVEAERRRVQDQSEWDRRTQRDREEAERKSANDLLAFERKSSQEKEETARRMEQDRTRIELEQKRLEEQRITEMERLRLEATRQDKVVDTRMERERLESERRREEAREERERWYKEIEQKRLEEERKRQTERDEWERRERERREESERKNQLLREEFIRQEAVRREEAERKERERKDDGERKERLERERMDRDRQDFQLRMEREKQESAEREGRRRDETQRDSTQRREEAERETARRALETQLQQKQMELSAQKDREHAERMVEMSRLERDTQREAQGRRETMEREAREQQERDRQRQHDLMIRELQENKERDREHQERMLQLSKIQQGGGSLLGTLGDTLGMEAPEILGRIFSPGDEGGGGGAGWAEAIPKVLGSLAELGKAAMQAKAPAQVQSKGRRQLPPGARVVQTEQGPQILLPGTATGIPLGAMPTPTPVHLPTDASIPPEFRGVAPDDDEDLSGDVEEAPVPEATEPEAAPVLEPAEVDTLERATAASLSLPEQKKARKALRALAEKLAETPDDDWIGVVTEAITDEMSIYYYIKAVTVAAAIEEAKPGDEELVTKVVGALKESGMVPEDVPLDEADYARLQAEGGE